MLCPYCKAQMEEGFVQSPHEISWKKGSRRPLLGRAMFHKGSVVLSELSFLKGSAVKAYLCRACRKVLIDYADETADFNRR